MNEQDQRGMVDRMTNIIMALPIKPQLKLAMTVEVLTILAHMMAMDKPDFEAQCEWREGDTVFSTPMRLLQTLDAHAREKGLGALPKKEHEGMREVAAGLGILNALRGGRHGTEANSER